MRGWKPPVFPRRPASTEKGTRMAHESDPATYPPAPLHGGLRSSPDSWELWGEIDYAVVESAQPRPSPAHGALLIDASRVTFMDSASASSCSPPAPLCGRSSWAAATTPETCSSSQERRTSSCGAPRDPPRSRSTMPRPTSVAQPSVMTTARPVIALRPTTRVLDSARNDDGLAHAALPRAARTNRRAHSSVVVFATDGLHLELEHQAVRQARGHRGGGSVAPTRWFHAATAVSRRTRAAT